MHKISTVNARVEPELKTKAENVLHQVGLTAAEAVRLFYKQICLHRGLPFDVKVPNSKTIKAMQDANKGRTHKAKSVDQLFEDLDL